MKLTYQPLWGDTTPREIEATITTDHPLSSYGQPVILLDDGDSLSMESWILLNYRAVETTPEEVELLKKWLSVIGMLVPRGAQQRIAGSVKTEKKARASAENGKLGGRPKKQTGH